LFGFLLVVLFVLVHRLAIRIHHVESQNRVLIQEYALLMLESSEITRNR